MAEQLPAVAGVLDITIEEGTDFNMTATWEDGGVAVDLTNYTAKMEIRNRAGDAGSALLTLTSSPAAGIVLGGVAGTITVTITDSQNVFADKSMVYDLEMTDGSGNITRLLRGKIISIAEVTK